MATLYQMYFSASSVICLFSLSPLSREIHALYCSDCSSQSVAFDVVPAVATL